MADVNAPTMAMSKCGKVMFWFGATSHRTAARSARSLGREALGGPRSSLINAGRSRRVHCSLFAADY